MQFEVDLETIQSDLKNKGVYILEDRHLSSLVIEARNEYIHAFDQLPMHAPAEKFTVMDLQDKPWRKLAIGASNGLGESYAQFLQTTYFYEKSTQYPYLVELFSKMIFLRNTLLNLPIDFGSDPERDSFWNACRVHHYPSGGGFMMAHKDTHFPKALALSNFPFLQIMIPLSQRGKDFNTGGGFFIEKNANQKNFFETPSSLGQVILFDGSIIHGVDDVDGDKVVDFQTKSGRFAAFVNVYQFYSK